jgi:hypothetical protein
MQSRQKSVVMFYVTTTIVEMDRASKALAEAPPNDTRTWAARADARGVALTMLYNRYHGRPPKDDVVQRQLLMSSFGQPVRIKYIITT